MTTALTKTVVDNFNDNSIGVMWDNWGGTKVTESSQQLNIATASSSSPNAWGLQLADVATFNFNEKFYGVKVVSVGSTTTGLDMFPIVCYVTSGSSNYVNWDLDRQANNASCWKNVNGTFTQVGTNLAISGANTWFAIGESGGTIRYWYSTDGVNFTEHASFSNPYGTTNLYTVSMEVGKFSGAATGVFTMTVDDFSTFTITSAPALSGTGSTSATTGLTVGTGVKGGKGTATAISGGTAGIGTAPGVKGGKGTASITAVTNLAETVSGTGLINTTTGLTSVGIKGGKGTGSLVDTLAMSSQGTRPPLQLVLPTVERPFGYNHRTGRPVDLFRFYTYPAAMGLQKVNGTWSLVASISSGLAEEFFQGGRLTMISEETANELGAAGFGQYVVEIPTTDTSTGYGSGTYGAGPYGG